MRAAGHTSSVVGLMRSRAVALAFICAALGAGCGFAGKSGGASSDLPPGSSGDMGGSDASGAGLEPPTGTQTGTGGSTVSGVPTGSGGAGGSFATGAAGASSGGTAGGTGTAGSTGTTGTAGTAGPDGGASDAGAACSVTIKPYLPDPANPGAFVEASFVNTHFEAGPSAMLRLVASVEGYRGASLAVKWNWIVEMAPASLVPDLWTHVDDAGTTIDVSIAEKGTYSLQALIEGAPTCDSAPTLVKVDAPQTPSFLFRVTPPSASQLPAREISVKPKEITGAPQALDLGAADATQVVSIAPLDARGFPIPSYIRITSPSFGFDVEGYTAQGALITPLATALTYNVLIVPDGAMAPLLVSGPSSLFSGKMAPLGPGATVTGTMRDGNGQAVAGARVILTAGQRPSTVGVSGADGSFALATREGTLSADIVPPVGSGLPSAHVSAGIVLPSVATALDLSMVWAKVPAAPLTVTVSGGGTLVAGARVRADLAGTLSAAATLTVHGGGDTHLPATGTAHAAGVTDAQGVAHLGLLPTGMYHLIVAPPEDVASVAITLADVALPGAGASPQISLAAPVTLSGTLQPRVLTTGAKVTAIDRGLLAAVRLPTATVSADGTYALSLAPGRSYELLVEPAAGQSLGRGVLAIVPPGGGARTDVVPAALDWAGSVTGAGRSVAGALVQVFCAAPASWCLDSTLAVAQGTTRADGTLTLVLPRPPGP
jgi:hypothetical protein